MASPTRVVRISLRSSMINLEPVLQQKRVAYKPPVTQKPPDMVKKITAKPKADQIAKAFR
jgi:hypothetical protein